MMGKGRGELEERTGKDVRPERWEGEGLSRGVKGIGRGDMDDGERLSGEER